MNRFIHVRLPSANEFKALASHPDIELPEDRLYWINASLGIGASYRLSPQLYKSCCGNFAPVAADVTQETAYIVPVFWFERPVYPEIVPDNTLFQVYNMQFLKLNTGSAVNYPPPKGSGLLLKVHQTQR